MKQPEAPEGYVLVPADFGGDLSEYISVRTTPETKQRIQRLAGTFHPPLATGQALRWLLNLPMIEDLVATREAAQDE